MAKGQPARTRSRSLSGLRRSRATSSRVGSPSSASTVPHPKDCEEESGEARLEAERQYRAVVENATDAIVTVDDAWSIVLVNPAVTKTFGYTPAELIGRPLTVLMPQRLAGMHQTAVSRYLETGKRHLNWAAVESSGQRKNGDEFPVEVSFTEVVRDGQRTFIGFIRDITERRQADELRAAQVRQAALRADVNMALASSDTLAGILQACAEALVRHLDAAFARVWLLARDKAVLELRASAGMYTHLDGAHSRIPVGHLKIGWIAQERVPHVTNDVATDPRISHREWARTEGMVAFAGYPLMVGSRVVGVVAMFSRRPLANATLDSVGGIADALAQGIQRKEAEEDVRRSEAFLAETQALSQTGSWGWNTATGELFWSRETYRIFQLDPRVTPTVALVAGLVHPEDRHLLHADVETLARARADFEREYRLELPDGASKRVHVVGHFVPGVFPDLDFIGSIMDVTERTRAREALLAAETKLAEVARLTTMGELAASIAHEINQPLATVVTNAQVCSRLLRSMSPDLAELGAAVSDIAEAGKRASDVIARIRLLLRKGMPQPVALDLNEVILEVIALVRYDMNKRRVVVNTDLAPDLPLARADRVQLEQVLVNLVTNAADAMASISGRPRTLTIRSRRNAERQVEVAVVDSGTGIESNDLDRIFDPFFTTKADGMGMGLAICRSIVEASGGRLEAANNPDVGATVRFVLPA